jgi:hypothetical protein
MAIMRTLFVILVKLLVLPDLFSSRPCCRRGAGRSAGLPEAFDGQASKPIAVVFNDDERTGLELFRSPKSPVRRRRFTEGGVWSRRRKRMTLGRE